MVWCGVVFVFVLKKENGGGDGRHWWRWSWRAFILSDILKRNVCIRVRVRVYQTNTAECIKLYHSVNYLRR